MKNQPLSRFLFRLILAGMILLMLGTSFAPSMIEAQTTTPNPDAEKQPVNPFIVSPYPAQAHEPTELRVILTNPGGILLTRYAQFYYSEFGIGQVLQPIGGRIAFDIPPFGEGSGAVIWVPPDASLRCFYVSVYETLGAIEPIASYWRNVNFLAHPNPLATITQTVFVPLRNPRATPALFSLSLSASPGTPTWTALVTPLEVMIPPGAIIPVQIDFTYTGNGQLPPDGIEIFTLRATVEQEPAGEVDIAFGPPLRLHMGPEPFFAESEISVDPYPTRAGEPTELCAVVRNVTAQPRLGLVHFLVAPFGIGTEYMEIVPPVEIFIPELGLQRACVMWVPAMGGQFAIEVQVETPGFPILQRSQRVIDASEVLLPGVPSDLVFPVRNFTQDTVMITLGLLPFMDGLSISLSQDVLPNMQPGQVVYVTLTVEIQAGIELPPDLTPLLDVQAFIGSNLIGGFRKVYRPPVPIHIPSDPIYAEREIKVRPYPPQAGEPTEICVELRNPTSLEQTLAVDFLWAEFGIGLPWHLLNTLDPVILPAYSLSNHCVMWVPPHGGRFGFEVVLHLAGHDPFFSQRVIDVGEILLPNQPTQFEFMVANPLPFPITVTLSAIRYLPQWEVSFDTPILLLDVGQVLPVVMTILPVQNPGDPEPFEGQPVIDVEAYWSGDGRDGQLLGGFRKVFFPPIPIHQPENPPYAEQEIFIMPYPPQAGEPTVLAFEARNPTDQPQQVTVTFEVGNLGIGLPFTPIATRIITIPALQTGVAEVIWVPPFAGEFCVRVRVEAPFFDQPFFSSRNISIVRLPEPYGGSELFEFAIGDGGNPTRPLTIELGLKTYLADWVVSLAQTQVTLQAGQDIALATLSLTPPADPDLLPKDGGPVADISGFVDGQLIGGIRKVWRPPVPLGQLGEPGYAESEIVIDPYPPVAGQPTTFSAEVRNNSDYTRNITVEFGWANFGAGIPFSQVGVLPHQTHITLLPNEVTTVTAQWTPQMSGSTCVQIILTDDQTGFELRSQRNVEVFQFDPAQCQVITTTFVLQNPSDFTVTVDLGYVIVNLPPGWTFTVSPTQVTLGPGESTVITVVITPLCPLSPAAKAANATSGPLKLQVEGYDQEGSLIGGVEIQVYTDQSILYLPVISR